MQQMPMALALFTGVAPVFILFIKALD